MPAERQDGENSEALFSPRLETPPIAARKRSLDGEGSFHDFVDLCYFCRKLIFLFRRYHTL